MIEGDKGMKEIEEIKKRDENNYPGADRDIQMRKDIQTLLSSLKATQLELRQADQLRGVRDGQLEELKVELEKERERLRLYPIILAQEKEKVIFWKGSYDEELAHSEQAEERVKELNRAIQQAQEENPDEKHCACVPLLKVRIKELEVYLQKLVKAVEKHKDTPNDTFVDQSGEPWILAKLMADAELYKVLASIKADESIGKLEVEGEFGKDD